MNKIKTALLAGALFISAAAFSSNVADQTPAANNFNQIDSRFGFNTIVGPGFVTILPDFLDVVQGQNGGVFVVPNWDKIGSIFDSIFGKPTQNTEAPKF